MQIYLVVLTFLLFCNKILGGPKSFRGPSASGWGRFEEGVLVFQSCSFSNSLSNSTQLQPKFDEKIWKRSLKSR